MEEEFTVARHFAGKDPVVKSIYERLVKEVRKFGPVVEESKKISIHLVNKSAFAGVVTHRKALILNIKSAAPIRHPRILKTERLSAGRFHQEVKLTSPREVNPLLVGWLLEAYAMSA